MSAVHVAVIEGKGETLDLFNDLGADLNIKTDVCIHVYSNIHS